MSGTGILPHSALAATNDGNKIRVYFQAYDGYLRESLTDDGSDWTTRHDHLPTPIKPKTFTPIACVNEGNISIIRVFYIDIYQVISELVFDGHDWAVGELNKKKITASSYSRLAAVRWNTQIYVHYQNSDNSICGLFQNEAGGQWTDIDWNIEKAIPGSNFAATVFIHPRLYYQAPNRDANITREQIRGMSNPTPSILNPPHGAYAAIYFGSSEIRVYFQKPDSNIYETCGGDSLGWSGGSESLGEFITQSFLAAVTWEQTNIRVYGQTAGDKVQELKWEVGKGWSKGSTIPTE